jgi:pimeloyl-ACP methyl ester carboxylesterase
MVSVILLPGIIAPAAVRYAPLLHSLDGISAVPTDMQVYANDPPPAGYSIDTELDGIDTAADHAGFERFHLYGHSGGGAFALAYAAARPGRLLSLAVDEPAADFTTEDQTDPYWDEIAAAGALPEPDSTRAFMRLQLAPGIDPPSPPPGDPPPWMARRPAGIRAFVAEALRHHVDPSQYQAFQAPVLFTHCSLSHPRWIAMRDRLASWFPDFSSELFEGLHHLHTSHQAKPERTAALLRSFWSRAVDG